MVPFGVQKHTCEWPCLVSSIISSHKFTWTASTTGPSILSNATLGNLSSSVKWRMPLEPQMTKKLEILTILTTYPLSPKFITGRTKFNFKMNFTLRQIWNSFGNSDFHFQSPQVRLKNLVIFFSKCQKKKTLFLKRTCGLFFISSDEKLKSGFF